MAHIFLHIPKTAGSSIRKTFEFFYKKERIYEFNYWSVGGFDHLKKNYCENIDLFFGHMPFGIHNHINQHTDS